MFFNVQIKKLVGGNSRQSFAFLVSSGTEFNYKFPFKYRLATIEITISGTF